MSPLVVFIVAGFLSGSIPFGLFFGRFRGIDIRQHGSGNIGATNVGRVLGLKLGLMCFALDLLKGFVPTFLAGLYLGLAGKFVIVPSEAWGWLLVMVAPVVGSMFCPWLGFKGGKGVAAALGSLLGVFPVLTISGACGFVLWCVTVRATRYVGLSSIVAACSLPVWVVLEYLVATWLGFRGVSEGATAAGITAAAVTIKGVAAIATPFVLLTALLSVLATIKHRANITRMRAGTEPRVTWFDAPTAGAPAR